MEFFYGITPRKKARNSIWYLTEPNSRILVVVRDWTPSTREKNAHVVCDILFNVSDIFYDMNSKTAKHATTTDQLLLISLSLFTLSL